MVRVLVLVHEDVAEGLLPLLARLGEPVEHVAGQHQQVVEVDGVRREQAPLVQVVHVGDGLVVERLHTFCVLPRSDELVLRVRDLVVDAARREPFRVALELLQALLHEADLVGLVVDREVGAVAEPLRFPPQDAPAGGMEREDPEAAAALAEQPPQPLLHLPGRLVRERDREDLVRLRADGVDQVRHSVREHPCLAGPGAGDHEQRPLGREDGLALRRIEVGEILLRRGDGHCRRC